ncbi:MAG: hypothetical protein R6V26_02375, partial [Roseovarius sp.]
QAYGKVRRITFRQVIFNTSVYMKPGEEPGEVFHYQSYDLHHLGWKVRKLAEIEGLRHADS